MTRQEANRQILQSITALVEGGPDLRFHQILHILNVTKMEDAKNGEPPVPIDQFNEESVKTLKRINETR